jgi:hypothetical protein
MAAPSIGQAEAMTWRRLLRRVALAMLVVFVVLQLVPYGWRHPNPPVTQSVTWASAEAETIARNACYDCHSNETTWPAYSYVAPMSWLVRKDVEAGRHKLNFSEWDRGGGKVDDAAETVQEGSMPPGQYTVLHPDARLSDTEKQTLIAALEQMTGSGGDNSGPGSGSDSDD